MEKLTGIIPKVTGGAQSVISFTALMVGVYVTDSVIFKRAPNDTPSVKYLSGDHDEDTTVIPTLDEGKLLRGQFRTQGCR